MSGPDNLNTPNKNPLQEFFQKNKSLAVLLPVLVVGVIAVVIIYANPGTKAKPASSYTPPITTQNSGNTNQNSGLSGQTVEILPQMERVTQSDIPLDSGVRDPFASDTGNTVMTLKGMALSGEESTAIIETDNRVYIVSVGDKVGDWSVLKINETGAELQDSKGNNAVLEFH